MLDQTTVRRREDGSIDIDFYRQQGLAERRAIMNHTIRSAGKPGKPLAALAIVVVTAVLTAMFASTGTASPAPM
ncbi:MAG: hypothetical protein WCE79_10410 [Xanthobacteraceae bacterium]